MIVAHSSVHWIAFKLLQLLETTYCNIVRGLHSWLKKVAWSDFWFHSKWQPKNHIKLAYNQSCAYSTFLAWSMLTRTLQGKCYWITIWLTYLQAPHMHLKSYEKQPLWSFPYFSVFLSHLLSYCPTPSIYLSQVCNALLQPIHKYFSLISKFIMTYIHLRQIVCVNSGFCFCSWLLIFSDGTASFPHHFYNWNWLNN